MIDIGNLFNPLDILARILAFVYAFGSAFAGQNINLLTWFARFAWFARIGIAVHRLRSIFIVSMVAIETAVVRGAWIAWIVRITRLL